MANIPIFAKLAKSSSNVRQIISAADAKNRLADALRDAESGDLVVITRYRRPVAALVGADRLDQLERLDAEDAGASSRCERHGDGEHHADSGADGSVEAAAEATVTKQPGTVRRAAEELRERAARGSLRRIDYDLARVPEKLQPVLRLIRANLFKPRLTVQRIQATLGVAGHDLTTEFGRVTGASIHRYLADRRLECGERLLVDTDLDVAPIARLVGYSRTESFARAFKKRRGVRPPIFRELRGELSLSAASRCAADRLPLAPRYLAGSAALPPGSRCGCGASLEPAAAVRVFEDLAPICDRCAREWAPELGALLDGDEAPNGSAGDGSFRP